MLCALLVAVAVDAHAESESPENRRERLTKMTAAQKEILRIKAERFERLSREERSRLRQLHEKLCCDPESERLQQIMVRYNEWLKTLPSAERARLLSLPAEQRIAAIRTQIEQQEKLQFHALVRQEMQPEDYEVILKWVDSLLNRHEDRILSGMSPEQRRWTTDSADPNRRRTGIFWGYIQQTGEQALPLTEDDIQDLATKVSDEARAVLDEASDAETKESVVQTWIFAAMTSGFRRRASHEDLQRFLEEKVSPTERERLENLPRDRMMSELGRMYFRDRMWGSGMWGGKMGDRGGRGRSRGRRGGGPPFPPWTKGGMPRDSSSPDKHEEKHQSDR